MAISVATVKKMAMNKVGGPAGNAKRARLTKKQIIKRRAGKPTSPKQKRAKLTKAQIAKRRAKGITTVSSVKRTTVPPNRATVPKSAVRRSVKSAPGR